MSICPMNNITKTIWPLRIIASVNILMVVGSGLYMLPILKRIQESPILITILIVLLAWVLLSNIAMLYLKEAGRRSFLVFLWLIILSLNFFLIFQTAPFFIDPASKGSRSLAVFLYIILLLPCGIEVVFLTNPRIISLFSTSSSK